MNTENMFDLTAAELDEVGGGLPLLWMPAAVFTVDWEAVVAEM